jgi:hypothetical protein
MQDLRLYVELLLNGLRDGFSYDDLVRKSRHQGKYTRKSKFVKLSKRERKKRERTRWLSKRK